MEIKLICSNCEREMLHDIQVDGDDATLEIYPCSHCKRLAYDEGHKNGVAEYLNAEVERREEDEKTTTIK